MPLHTQPEWKHYRVIHSFYPPVNLFDTVSEEDAQLMAELAGETSDRLMRWRENVSAMDARFGNGWGAVMASFCYIREGRFNTNEFGCYYASNNVHTAIKEWSFHAGRVWLDFNYREDAHAVVRCYLGHVEAPLVDSRRYNRVHSPDDYHYSQQYGSSLHKHNEWGIVYRSVRNAGGLCIGLFRPPATSPVSQQGHYVVNWNGERFFQYARMNKFSTL